MGSASLKRETKGTKTFFLWLFLGCLLLSLGGHCIFFFKAKGWRVSGFTATSYDTIIPRSFRMKRVEIDPKLLEETAPEATKERVPQPIILEKEKPSSDKKQKIEAPSPFLSKPDGKLLDELQSMRPPAGELAGKGLGNILPKGKDTDFSLPEPEGMTRENQGLPEGKDATQSGEEGGGGSKFSNLDELLAGHAQVSAQTAPILMPTDLLFEYDSDSLKPAAAESLSKLATLIEKNARANFRIEGHTDSFGSDEYNQGLSLRRADAVKKWLQQRMGIDDARISTAGLGKSKLLVPATGSVREQQINRRVEIVISTQ